MSPHKHSSRVSRRQLVRGALAAITLPLVPGLWRSQALASAPQPLNRYPRMVHDWYVQQLRDAERRSQRIKSELKSRSDAERYVQQVRRKIRACFGPEPDRTPLHPVVTGTVERDAYHIEKLIYESRPGFPVTANLYVPKNRSLPLPAVVGTCGHSANGKAAEFYQGFAQGLARLGYICLIYDPIGQGERLQYVRDDLSPARGTGTSEHLLAGNQQYLVGEFLGMWRAWDGMRAVDYLLGRKEVDPKHLGVTGNSGGGTMTTWLCGVEPRWTMAAPACFVTTFRRNLENELPADTEQCPPRAIALGLDHDDFLAAQAPDPIIILGKERDYFDVRGTEQAYQRLRHLYRLLGAEQEIALFVGPTEHGFSQENREAMYGWFNRVTGVAENSSEPPLTIEEDETLWCTPKGQVAGLAETRTVFHFTRDKARRLAETRGPVSGPRLRQAVVDVLKLRPLPAASPDYAIWRHLGGRDYPSKGAIAYAVETEPGIQAICYRLTDARWHSRPPQAGARALLYVAHLSSDAELREEPLVGELLKAEPDTPLFTCDVRGIGESLPGTTQPGSFDSPYGCDYFYAAHGLMLDRPYLGQKTWDVLRVLQWLESLGHSDVHLAGRGWGAVVATLAAVLSDTVRQVTLKHALTSYLDVAETEGYQWPLSMLPPNVLAHFDLPDCYQALVDKPLRQIEPWDGTGRVVGS